LCKKAKFAPTQILPFCWLSKRQNTRPLQATLARLNIATKRQKQIRLNEKLGLPKEGNQLKRLHTSMRPQAHEDKLFWCVSKNHSNTTIDTPPVKTTLRFCD
jgi:hypothetical protein